MEGIRACVFDAYGTLFDFNGAALAASDQLGENAPHLSEIWRQKQLQYTWLRGLAGRHADFWQVTGDALDYALGALGIDRPGLRAQLLDLYLHLDCYPEVPETLSRLQAAGLKLAILSNGTPAMLAAVVRHNGLESLLDRPDGYLLPLVERLGCLLGQGIGLARPVVQPLFSGARAHSRDTGWRNPGSVGSAVEAPACHRPLAPPATARQTVKLLHQITLSKCPVGQATINARRPQQQAEPKAR